MHMNKILTPSPPDQNKNPSEIFYIIKYKIFILKE